MFQIVAPGAAHLVHAVKGASALPMTAPARKAGAFPDGYPAATANYPRRLEDGISLTNTDLLIEAGVLGGHSLNHTS